MYQQNFVFILGIIAFLPFFQALSCDDISLDATGDVCGGVFDSFTEYKFMNSGTYSAGLCLLLYNC